jgi:hypothetical protein
MSLDDPFSVVRRAILLRSILERSAPQLFESRGGRRLLHIDPGVLRAFLLTREYRHGARSLESIVASSLLAGATSFQRSSLPAEAQLELHVDGRDFLALVQQLELEGELLERLAAAAHEIFCEGLRSRGYALGDETDDGRRTHRLLRPFAELADQDRQESRATVRDIPDKLARAGYVMLPARSDEPPFAFPPDDLERLSESEHERFVAAKLAAGWAYAPQTDRARRLHVALVPWSELPESQREKDRDLVGGIPEILARAGYTIVRSRR